MCPVIIVSGYYLVVVHMLHQEIHTAVPEEFLALVRIRIQPFPRHIHQQNLAERPGKVLVHGQFLRPVHCPDHQAVGHIAEFLIFTESFRKIIRDGCILPGRLSFLVRYLTVIETDLDALAAEESCLRGGFNIRRAHVRQVRILRFGQHADIRSVKIVLHDIGIVPIQRRVEAVIADRRKDIGTRRGNIHTVLAIVAEADKFRF